jgi:hypothetical protein
MTTLILPKANDVNRKKFFEKERGYFLRFTQVKVDKQATMNFKNFPTFTENGRSR